MHTIFQFVALFALVAVAAAFPGEYHQAPAYHQVVAAPIHHHAPLLKQVEYEAPAKYDFSYGVHDAHTGDIKEQKESNDNGNVHGSYSLIDADGYKRTVEYTADDHNGFNAVVHREPLGHKVAVAPVQKVYAAAPVAHYGHHY